MKKIFGKPITISELEFSSCKLLYLQKIGNVLVATKKYN